MPSAYHTVHYRQLEIAAAAKNVTGEKLSRSALSAAAGQGPPLWQRVKDRVLDLADDRQHQLVLNRVADQSSAVFGEMCLLQQGGFQALLELKASQKQLSTVTLAEIFALEEKAAPTGSHFVRGILYWLMIGNHVLFVRLQSATPDHLARYLAWLWQVQTKALAADATFDLRAEFDRSQVNGDIGDIRSFRVGGITTPHVLTPAPRAPGGGKRVVSTARQVGSDVAEYSKAIPIIELVLGKKRTESLLHALGEKEYLAVDTTVKVKGQRTVESRDQAKSIASALANITDGDVRVEGRDGKWSGADAILRTRMPFDVASEGSALLDFDNVSDQLREVYSRFVHDGKIPA